MPEVESGDQPGRRQPGWAVPTAAAAAVAGLVLLLVGLGARASYGSQLIPSAQRTAAAGSVSAAVGQVVMVAFFAVVDLVVLAMLVFAPWDRFRNVGKPGPPVARLNRGAKLRLVALAFSMLFAEVLVLVLGLHPRAKLFTPNPGSGTPPALHGAEKYSAGAVPIPQTLLLSMIIAVVVGIVAFAYWLVRRRQSSHWRSRSGSQPPIVDLPEEIAGALEGGLEEIDSGRNPREAVITAYARMERALAAEGLARQAHETHLEYLDRALKGLLPSRRSLERLTDLFEQARFSAHPITHWEKVEAELALTRLRDELRAAPPS